MRMWLLMMGMLVALAGPLRALEQPGYGDLVVLADTEVSPSEQGPGGVVTVTVFLKVEEDYGLDTGALRFAFTGVAADWEVEGGLEILNDKGEPADMTADYQVALVGLRQRLKLPDSLVAGEKIEIEFKADFAACNMVTYMCLPSSSLSGKLSLPVGAGEIAVEPDPVPEPVQNQGRADSEEDAFAGKSMVGALALAFLLGLGLLLTPCIYPLIPVTMALTGATASKSKLAGLVHSFVYVLGICLTYSIAGVTAALSGGAFQSRLQGPTVAIILAIVFVAMAAAMFDIFTVQIASQRLSRMQAKLRGKGGLLGLFAIGVLSGVGVTACIAPVLVAGIAYVTQRGDALYGFLFFFAMSWGFGLPLVLLGTFSGLLGSIPKPGEWMNTVKHFMGLALLAAALFYLGNSHVLSAFAFSATVCGFLLVSAVFVGAFDSLSSGSTRGARVKKAFGLLLLAAAVWSFIGLLPVRAGGNVAPAATVDWRIVEPGQEDALDAGGRPVLLDYWGEDCAYCLEMLDTTFVAPQVVAESRRFVFAKIDMTKEVRSGGSKKWREVADRHKAPGMPLVVLKDSSGEVVKVWRGFVNAEDMLEELRKVQ